eukprot:2282517-Pleurochrysis_carterae.AAC.2
MRTEEVLLHGCGYYRWAADTKLGAQDVATSTARQRERVRVRVREREFEYNCKSARERGSEGAREQESERADRAATESQAATSRSPRGCAHSRRRRACPCAVRSPRAASGRTPHQPDARIR